MNISGGLWIKTIVLITTISILTCGCSNISDELEKASCQIETAIENGDVKTIENLIFSNEYEIKAEEDLDNLISKIIMSDSVEVETIDSQNCIITYIIKSPDLSEIFDNIPSNIDQFTDQEIEKYFVEYIESSNQTEKIVEVPYAKDGREYLVDYHNSDFINALTGNIFSAYQEYYSEWIESINKAIGDIK